MKTQIIILISFLILEGCSAQLATGETKKLPNISNIISNQIQRFQQDKKHGLAWVYNCGTDQKQNPKDLKGDLEKTIKLDIDSVNISRYKFQEKTKGRLKVNEWNNSTEKFRILEYETEFKGYPVKLLELTIINEKGEIYVFALTGGPIQRFVYYGKEYCPIYESRLLGLDEIIGEFEKIKNR